MILMAEVSFTQHNSVAASGAPSAHSGSAVRVATQDSKPAVAADVRALSLAQQSSKVLSSATERLSGMTEDLRQVVESLNAELSKKGRSLGFSFDETIDRPIVSVVDKSTGKVVRQIPNEVVVRVAHSIEAFRGSFVDKSV
jgi:flagellar protein FlaG